MQGTQEVLPLAAQAPRAQHTPAPTLLLVPAPQGVGTDTPMLGQKKLAGQAVQTLAAMELSTLLYRPMAQAVQLLAPAALHEPAAQGRGADSPGVGQEAPALQFTQVEIELAPGVSLNLPAPQRVQAVLVLAAQAPSAQHTPAPALLLVPADAGQGRQAVAD